MPSRLPFPTLAVVSVLSLFIAACAAPNQPSIAVRKESQSLRDQIRELQRQHEADQARIRGLESRTALPTLPEDRLGRLFTTHTLRFSRLTGGSDLETNKTVDQGVKVYVVPIDQNGDSLKAAGSFVVQLFDLSQPDKQKIGEWSFDHDQAVKSWFGGKLLYTYVLLCPWQQVPRHHDLTVRVTFTDELTQRIFIDQVKITVNPPPATNPTTVATDRPQ